MIRAIKNGCKNYFDAALRTEWDLTVQDKFGKNVFDYAREQGFYDSGEILSHRVFRDDREYEEYLKTIYKTEDSKWQF